MTLKLSDSKVPTLELWGMWSTLLWLLPGLLWPRVIVPIRIPPLESFNCVQMNELCWIKLLVLNSSTLNHITVYKQMSSGTFKNVAYKLVVLKSYLLYICINRIWHWITHKGWYAIKHNQTNTLLQIGCNRRSMFKWSTAGLNLYVWKWVWNFWIVFLLLDRLSYYLPIAGGRTDEFLPFLKH